MSSTRQQSVASQGCGERVGVVVEAGPGPTRVLADPAVQVLLEAGTEGVDHLVVDQARQHPPPLRAQCRGLHVDPMSVEPARRRRLSEQGGEQLGLSPRELRARRHDGTGAASCTRRSAASSAASSAAGG